MKVGWLRIDAARIRAMRVGLLALWKLLRHPHTPRHVRWLALAVLAYAVSPIDLVPDFIPVLGLLDDLILIPLGVALVVRLTPPALWQQCLADAAREAESLPRWRAGAVAVVLVWLVLLAGVAWAWLA